MAKGYREPQYKSNKKYPKGNGPGKPHVLIDAKSKEVLSHHVSAFAAQRAAGSRIKKANLPLFDIWKHYDIKPATRSSKDVVKNNRKTNKKK